MSLFDFFFMFIRVNCEHSYPSLLCMNIINISSSLKEIYITIPLYKAAPQAPHLWSLPEGSP